MARTSYAIPPDFRTDPEAFRDWCLEVGGALFGLGEDTVGSLSSSDNIPDSVISGNPTVASQGSSISNLEDSNHPQGKDQSLDLDGANEVLVADVKDAVTKKHDPGSSHAIIIQAASQSDVPSATAVNPPSGGTGTASGGYDTAGNRDLMIASLTATISDVAAMKVALDGLLLKLRISNSVAT